MSELTNSELFNPAFFSPDFQEASPIDARDTADVITKVYTDLGIFNGDMAEQAPELLWPQIAGLHETHAGNELESFVAVNLTPNFGLKALLTAFDAGSGKETWVWNPLWDHYDLDNLNRRTIDGQEPAHGELRGHVLSAPENNYDEPGLIETGKNLEKQRKAARGKVLLNATDVVLINAVRREEGRPQLDERTVTRFPQMDKVTVGGASVVGSAGWHGGRLYLSGSDGRARSGFGFRRSVGLF